VKVGTILADMRLPALAGTAFFDATEAGGRESSVGCLAALDRGRIRAGGQAYLRAETQMRVCGKRCGWHARGVEAGSGSGKKTLARSSPESRSGISRLGVAELLGKPGSCGREESQLGMSLEGDEERMCMTSPLLRAAANSVVLDDARMRPAG